MKSLFSLFAFTLLLAGCAGGLPAQVDLPTYDNCTLTYEPGDAPYGFACPNFPKLPKNSTPEFGGRK